MTKQCTVAIDGLYCNVTSEIPVTNRTSCIKDAGSSEGRVDLSIWLHLENLWWNMGSEYLDTLENLWWNRIYEYLVTLQNLWWNRISEYLVTLQNLWWNRRSEYLVTQLNRSYI